MEKINQNPENKVSKLEQEKGELAFIPIFRNNDLYHAMFPEIKPLFEKGEDVDMTSIKKVVDAIIANENKAVIVDETCKEPLLYIELEHLPEKFALKELPTSNGGFDLEVFQKLLKTHYNIDFDPYTSIDEKLRKKIGQDFSVDLAKSLFEIAKNKNKNIKQVYILNNNIGDHAILTSDNSEYVDSAKEITTSITFESNESEERKERVSLILAILKKAVEEEFGIEPKIVQTIKQSDISEGDLVIVDRHNSAISNEKLNEILPKQISLLPIETELYNNERFLGNELPSDSLANMLRKDFEKSGV
jgi:hypothetical protein